MFALYIPEVLCSLYSHWPSGKDAFINILLILNSKLESHTTLLIQRSLIFYILFRCIDLFFFLNLSWKKYTHTISIY